MNEQSAGERLYGEPRDVQALVDVSETSIFVPANTSLQLLPGDVDRVWWEVWLIDATTGARISTLNPVTALRGHSVISGSDPQKYSWWIDGPITGRPWFVGTFGFADTTVGVRVARYTRRASLIYVNDNLPLIREYFHATAFDAPDKSDDSGRSWLRRASGELARPGGSAHLSKSYQQIYFESRRARRAGSGH